MKSESLEGTDDKLDLRDKQNSLMISSLSTISYKVTIPEETDEEYNKRLEANYEENNRRCLAIGPL